MRVRFLLFVSIVVFVASITAIAAQQPCRADAVFDYAMMLLKKRDFTGALKYFDQRLKSVPRDEKAMYYKGLCHHYKGDRETARQIYAQVLEQFPNTPSARLAAAALEKMGGAPPSHGSAPRASSAALLSAPSLPSSQNIPKETRVYFRMEGNSIMIPVKINGRDFDFCFDTGAHSVLVKKEDFDRAQLHIPENAQTQEGGGIGGTITSKVFNAEVSVGGIKRTVPISVTDGHTPENLLGQTWLGDLEYEFDHKSNYITFRPPRAADTASAVKDGFAVPFTLRGKHLIVDVFVPGGKSTKMIVDTGAESIMLTQKNFDDLGLTLTDSARRMNAVGVGGGIRKGYAMYIDELRLGNIICREPEIHVVEDSEDGMNFGLLGMPFLGGWRYTVDRKNQLLRFFH